MLQEITREEKEAWIKANPNTSLANSVRYLPWRKTFLDTNCELTIETLAWIHVSKQCPYQWLPLTESSTSNFVRITLYNTKEDDPTESTSNYEHVLALIDGKYLVQSYFGKHKWHCAELTMTQRSILNQTSITSEQYMLLCPPGVKLSPMDETFILQRWACKLDN